MTKTTTFYSILPYKYMFAFWHVSTWPKVSSSAALASGRIGLPMRPLLMALEPLREVFQLCYAKIDVRTDMDTYWASFFQPLHLYHSRFSLSYLLRSLMVLKRLESSVGCYDPSTSSSAVREPINTISLRHVLAYPTVVECGSRLVSALALLRR